MSKREQRKKLLEKTIKSATKKGADLSGIIKNKSVDEIVRLSSKSFDRIIQRIKERHAIEKDIFNYEEKLVNKKFSKILGKKIDKKDMSLSNLIKEVSLKAKNQVDLANIDTKNLKKMKGFETRKNFPQFQPFTQAKNKKDLLNMAMKLDEKPNFKRNMEDYITYTALDFFSKYFKELTVSPVHMDRIDALANSFGTRFDKLNSLIDLVIADDFKIYTDGNINLKEDDSESYFDMMKSRLDRVEQLRLTL